MARLKLIGIFAGVGAAVGYTATNVFLRSASDVDPALVSWSKAIWTVLIFGPWLLYLASKRVRVLPTPRTLGTLGVAACFAQLGGNICFQWCLGYLGLAITVAIVMGGMLIGGIVLGKLLLHEHVKRATIVAIVVMLAAILSVSWGLASKSNSPLLDGSNSVSLWSVIGGLAVACICGTSYAILGIGIRYAMKETLPLASPMMVMGLAGVILIGALVWIRVDLDELRQVETIDWVMMSLAGVANALAFLSLTLSLKLIPVAFVNAINASQVTLAAVAGVVIFGESLTLEVSLGIFLTVLGFGILNFAGLQNSLGRRWPRPRPQAATPQNAVVDSDEVAIQDAISTSSSLQKTTLTDDSETTAGGSPQKSNEHGKGSRTVSPTPTSSR